MNEPQTSTAANTSELSALLGDPIETTEPYWMLHELWRRLPPSEAQRVISAAMQDIDAKDNALREAVRYMRGCSKLCADVVDDACCSHVLKVCEAALTPNAPHQPRCGQGTEP